MFQKYYPHYRLLQCNNCAHEFWRDVRGATKLDVRKIIGKCPRCEHDQLNVIGDRNGHFRNRE